MSTLKSNGVNPEWVQVGNETNNGMLCEVDMDVNSPLICKAFLTDIINKTKSVSGGKGIGVFYWETECYGDWNKYYKGAFDSTGKPTAALDAFI